MKKYLFGLFLVLSALSAHAQSNSSAYQSSGSNSTAQNAGNAQNIVFNSNTPTDSHVSETIRNVSAPIMGAYASSFSQLNCGSTTQAGFAVAGFSAGGGSSKDSYSCVLLSTAAEMIRTTLVINGTDPASQAERNQLVQSALNMRCMISEDIYRAMVAAGVVCQTKPKSMESNSSAQASPYDHS